MSGGGYWALPEFFCSTLRQWGGVNRFFGGGAVGLMSRVFANGSGDQGSIPGWVVQKTQKNGTWCRLA